MAASSVAAAGLAFAIALAEGGRSVPIDRFTLKVPGVKGALVLSLEFAQNGDRILTAKVPPSWEGRWPPR